MRGITRPCRHTMDKSLYRRWQSHQCGLCLTLRDEAGQASRVLTGYDMILLSVLVEAQTGTVETTEAGRCPLRGMRTATVVAARDPAAQFAAASSLLAGSAALDDKVLDGDLPRLADPLAARCAQSVGRTGRRLAAATGLDGDLFSDAVRRSQIVESGESDLADLLAPSGEVAAELFAHTAAVAGRPENADRLRRAGDAFGRLVHLIDAADDYRSDGAAGKFNPLAATATPPEVARELALSLAATVQDEVAGVDFADPTLVEPLLGPVLERAARNRFRSQPHETHPVSPAGSLVAVSVALTATLGLFGRRRRMGYYDPYGMPPRRRGGGLCCCDCCSDCCCACECCECAECCGDGDCC